MPLPCVELLALYRPRDPRASALWCLMDQHFPTFQHVYDERYEFRHPHIHTLVTCGGFTPEGDFLEVHELDMDRLNAAWREAVFALYLAEDKIGPEVVENMRTCQSARGRHPQTSHNFSTRMQYDRQESLNLHSRDFNRGAVVGHAGSAAIAALPAWPTLFANMHWLESRLQKIIFPILYPYDLATDYRLDELSDVFTLLSRDIARFRHDRAET